VKRPRKRRAAALARDCCKLKIWRARAIKILFSEELEISRPIDSAPCCGTRSGGIKRCSGISESAAQNHGH
jgi:hypothetical protein